MSEFSASSLQAPELLKLLAHDLRWHLLTVLTQGDYRVQELVEVIREPMNLVSYHLKKLRDSGIVTMRRSEADGRDIYYTLDVLHLRDRFRDAGGALHPAIGALAGEASLTRLPPQRVLFVCTHNSARSQMAQGLMHALSEERIQAQSAGSHPTHIHPDALRTMDALGIDIHHQQAKHLHEFEGQTFDYVITVCDRARELCPTFPGGAQQLHWGFADPTLIPDVSQRQQVFDQIAGQLSSRINVFLRTLSASA